MALKTRINHTKSAMKQHPLAVGVGLAAAAATAYYLFGSKKAAEHRDDLKRWTLRMKTDVMRDVSRLKQVNKQAYNTAVNTISEKYKQLKNVDPQEVTALATRMKDHWSEIRKDIEATASKGRSNTRSAATAKRKSARSRRSSRNSSK